MREEGVAEIGAAIERHMAHLRTGGRIAEYERVRAAREFQLIVQETALEQARARVADTGWDALVGRIARREIDPYTAAAELFA